MVNVGIYASPMDAMGYIDFRSSRKCVLFWGGSVEGYFAVSG